MKKNNFLTYNQKNQHFNIGNGNFPLLSAYLNTLDISQYQHEPFISDDKGVRTVVEKSVKDFFNRTYAQIKLPYDKFKPLADEYVKAVKLGGEPNYIPVVIKSNNYKIGISHE